MDRGAWRDTVHETEATEKLSTHVWFIVDVSFGSTAKQFR